MNTELSQVNRAASHAVATALAPKNSVKAGVNSQTLNSTATAKSSATPAAAATTGTSTTSSAATSTSTITGNDFLTLLVGELKNQDPTQPTDPNAYITQLVGVNSLEQLISINQGITSLDTAATTATTPTTPTTGS